MEAWLSYDHEHMSVVIVVGQGSIFGSDKNDWFAWVDPKHADDVFFHPSRFIEAMNNPRKLAEVIQYILALRPYLQRGERPPESVGQDVKAEIPESLLVSERMATAEAISRFALELRLLDLRNGSLISQRKTVEELARSLLYVALY